MKATSMLGNNMLGRSIPANVLEYLERSARAFPDSPAYCSPSYADTLTGESVPGEQLTFGELRRQAQILGSLLAKKLAEKIAIPESSDGSRDSVSARSPLVALLMERKPHAVTALTGILYAGGHYVFLDPSLPENRIRELLEFLQPDGCLADRKYLETARRIWDKPLCLEELTGQARTSASSELTSCREASAVIAAKRFDSSTVCEQVELPQLPELLNRDPAQTLCLTFTSSSSGQPKCVETSHLSVIRYIEGLTDILQADEKTVFGELAPFFLDASLKEIYTTLKNGCRTWFIPENLSANPLELVAFLNERSINTVCWVSSALHLLAVSDVFSELPPKSLRTIAFGSEVLPAESLAVWQKAAPTARFLNLYGPTEATGMSLYYQVPSENHEIAATQPECQAVTDSPEHQPSPAKFSKTSIPIGKPFPGVEILLLTESGESVLTCGIGEIYLRSNRLAKGYYHNEELTKRCFLPDPAGAPDFGLYRTGDLGRFLPDGNLLFLGRADQQVKRMGYRIDLTELERLACSCELTGLACCVQKSDGRIVLYLSPVSRVSYPDSTKSCPTAPADTPESCQSTTADSPTATADELRSAVWTILRGTLPRHQLPNQITVLPELPRLPGGKLNRAQMRTM